jgi:cytochrome c oxidase cbb3-type subunit 2
MRMTPALVVVGGLLVFWAAAFVSVILPSLDEVPPSADWRPLSEKEKEGHDLYVANGCSYCHSQYVRPQDWGVGAWRIAQPGDYHGVEPAILGSERTGPDLSQEGGLHPDDWHLAHFVDPRSTRPDSVMPDWLFLDRGDPNMKNLKLLTAYVQSRGGQAADAPVARPRKWEKLAIAAHDAGPDANVAWLHDHVPHPWVELPNPYPADASALERGRKVYQDFCIGCHGAVGDGRGIAAQWLDPPPLDFTTLKAWAKDHKLGGILYYQIMNGITGTAMPFFKTELESEKIWDVSNYVAETFVTITDANTAPRGIDASYEPVDPSDEGGGR